jgi:hypothetical protein
VRDLYKNKFMIKEKIKEFVPQRILDWAKENNNKKLFQKWEREGYPIPTPHLYKQQLIQAYKLKYNYRILVETGTYLGDMVEAQKTYFDQVISIELSAFLYEKAKKRFKRDKHVTIYPGDSGQVLPSILKGMNTPAIFWLDGHYSKGITAKGDKDCPIFEELNAIFNASNLPHVLLIDDARCFTGNGEYPAVDAVSDLIKTKNNRYQISIAHDIIRVEIPN